MKFGLIGPTHPFKGGISHYTTLLYQELANEHQIHFFAFSRSYPKFLFPGDEGIDESKKPIKTSEVKKVIDWANPFTWIKTGLKIRKLELDLIIFPWWMWGWAIPFWIIAKIGNKKILFICHNVIEHESSWWKKMLTKLVLSQGDYYIVHSKDDKINLKKIFPEAKITKTFHPTYDIFNQKRVGKIKAKKEIKIKVKHKKIILFFGFVRHYKGLDILLHAMPDISKKLPDLALVIAGEFWDDKQKYMQIIKDLKIKDQIYLFDKYIPNEEVSLYFSASDLVVLPYRSATGSGITQIAFGFNKPVIATNFGDLPDVVSHKRRGVIIKKHTPLNLSREIVNVFKSNDLEKYTKNIKKDKHLFSWQKLVKSIEKIK